MPSAFQSSRIPFSSEPTRQHSADPASLSSATGPGVPRHADVAVIGGSAAGLAAALQLSRQGRSIIVVDGYRPRNAPASAMHSYLGHEGRSPSDFLTIARTEVRSYGAEILEGTAVDVARDSDGFRVSLSGGHVIIARRVIAATGVADELPAIPGLAEHWGASVIHCPFCHGYESRGRRIVALLTSPAGLHALPLLRQLTERLTIVVDASVLGGEELLSDFRTVGVQVIVSSAERILNDEEGKLRGLLLSDGREISADTIFVGPRLHAQVAPFKRLGLATSEHPSGIGSYIEADAVTGSTAVPGLYATGTLTAPALQVLPAAASGAQVGAMVSMDLAKEDLSTGIRPVAHAADWDTRYSGNLQWSGNPNGSVVAEVSGIPPGSALDIGSGEGGDAFWLAERGWKVTASDISDRALERVRAEAQRRNLPVETLHADANAVNPFAGHRYDLVTASYASIPRTPDRRGTANLLDAVAPGGQLLIINHDVSGIPGTHVHGDTQFTSPFDHDAFVSTGDFVKVLSASAEWVIEVNECRERPTGATSTHHTNDLVLRARRSSGSDHR